MLLAMAIKMVLAAKEAGVTAPADAHLNCKRHPFPSRGLPRNLDFRDRFARRGTRRTPLYACSTGLEIGLFL